jgi:hypothetical protein
VCKSAKRVALVAEPNPQQEGERMSTHSSLSFARSLTHVPLPSAPTRTQLRMVRPSLLDLRFTGDHWIVDRKDGSFKLFLGDYCLTGFRGMTFDLPSFNQALDRMRTRRPRRAHAS